MGNDLEKITTYAGINAFLISMVFPPLLAFMSKRKMVSQGLSWETAFSNKYFSNEITTLSMLLLGVCFFIFVIFEVVQKEYTQNEMETRPYRDESGYYEEMRTAVVKNITNLIKDSNSDSS